MSLNLNLSKQNLQLTLEKKNIPSITNMNVEFAMDVSGSFDDEHRNGYTQQFLNRFVPFALLFDPDKKMGMYAFSSSYKKLKDVSESNYQDYVSSTIMTCSVYNGGTNYSEVIREMIIPSEDKSGFFSKLFKTNESKTSPKLCFFVTDGEPSDSSKTLDVLKEIEGSNTFIVLISISRTKINFLETMQKFQNVTYMNFTPQELKQIQSVSDENLYDRLLDNELTTWLKSYNSII